MQELNVKNGTMVVNLAKFPKRLQPKYDKDITKEESTKAYVVGWMKGARKKPAIYRKHGAKRIKFVFGKVKVVRKI